MLTVQLSHHDTCLILEARMALGNISGVPHENLQAVAEMIWDVGRKNYVSNHGSQAPTDQDRALGMHQPISRRDFLNGVAVSLGSFGLQPEYYPPALTGMRGSHDGAYAYAHALRDGTLSAAGPVVDANEEYDLLVVGAGISGLAAAYFWRARKPGARILILDNHDDFGGHAKRNEFGASSDPLITNGGTLDIDSPFDYSAVAAGLLTQLGIDPPALQEKSNLLTDRSRLKNLNRSVFFDKEAFGVDRLVTGPPSGRQMEEWRNFLARTPLSDGAKEDILRLQTELRDYLPGLTSDQKKDRLSRMSYKDFLLNVVRVHADVVPFYQTRTHDLYGIGIDAVAALELWPDAPGFAGLGLEPGPHRRLSFTARGEHIAKKPYRFHFPDGNASIARLLVRSLIPGSLPGRSAEDSVTAHLDYSRLDRSSNAVRLRLSSTCVQVRQDPDQVDVLYARESKVYRVRAKAVVLACWNMMIPYLCPDLPADQKKALHYGVKVPLVYTVVAVRNWQAFKKLGIRRIETPGMYHSRVALEVPTNIGHYHPEFKPESPALVRMLRTPCQPGLAARDQHRAGHVDLFNTTFETFERNIRDQLLRILGPGGFDAARDITAITVNRWPHGYAYEYNFLWDPEWRKGESPCEIARRQFGRISIANSDAAAAAYTDQAIDQGYRAVQEQFARNAETR